MSHQSAACANPRDRDGSETSESRYVAFIVLSITAIAVIAFCVSVLIPHFFMISGAIDRDIVIALLLVDIALILGAMAGGGFSYPGALFLFAAMIALPITLGVMFGLPVGRQSYPASSRRIERMAPASPLARSAYLKCVSSALNASRSPITNEHVDACASEAKQGSQESSRSSQIKALARIGRTKS